jgi:iron(III) transport system permease protein
MILVQARLLRGKSFTTISGRRFSARVSPLGPWRWVVFAVVALYVTLGMLLPLGTLISGSFMRSWGIWDLGRVTLANWQQSFADPRLVAAIGNTVLLGLLVGLCGTTVAALAAYVLVRTRFRARPLLEFVTWAPRVAPGVVLALAFLWAYLARLPFPNPLAGTLGIMVLVVAVNALPLSSRVMSGAMHQISAELEEAGRVGGAAWSTVFRHIMVPLLAPALTTCFVLLFLSAIRNLVLVVFFYTPSTRVLASIFWEAWTGNFPERALVSGFLMMLMSLVALGVASFAGRRSSIASL